MERGRSDSTSELLRACAHPTRLLILQELLDGPKCVTDIEDLLSSRQPNISQHLTVLRHAQLVDFAQDGTLRCYYLSRPKFVRRILALLAEDEPVVKRSRDQIAALKRRRAKAACSRADA